MKEIIRYTGPYIVKSGKNTGRKFMVTHFEDGSKGTTLYSRYLYQKEYNVILDKNVTVDHVDENKANDHLGNFQLLTREDNARKSALLKGKEWSKFICPICKIETSKPSNRIRHNLKQGKAGPFCGRKCARRFQSAGMAKSEVAVDLKSTIITGVGVQVPLPAPLSY